MKLSFLFADTNGKQKWWHGDDVDCMMPQKNTAPPPTGKRKHYDNIVVSDEKVAVRTLNRTTEQKEHCDASSESKRSK